MDFDNIYHNGFLELGFKFIEWKNIGILKHPWAKSQIEILNEVYSILVSENLLMKIEQLPQADKDMIWEQAKPFTIHLPKNDKIKYAKAIYVLEEEKKITSETPKRHPADIQPMDQGT